MDELKQNILREIVGELDCGNDCYYNVKTNKMIAIPNDSILSEDDEFKEAFRADLEKVHQSNADFIKIESLEGFESFKIMEQFVEQLKNQHFKFVLQNVLRDNKPFQNFNSKIDNSDFRQSWFDFKESEQEKVVSRIIHKLLS
tara:strand:+ start:13927 stop:14355 length:429 start_codon:yes stop_codon:yes gene_type:complete